MVYEIKQTQAVIPLFAGWEETMIYSCLQQVMGHIYVTQPQSPKAACARIGCFAFFAGEPCEELVKHVGNGFVIMAARDSCWEALFTKIWPQARAVTRYAFAKNTQFDRQLLSALTALPEGYCIRPIDDVLYDRCLQHPQTTDFVASFGSKEAFLRDGLGMVILKDETIAAGASSFSRYRDGIEIEVDTLPEYRRQGLAAAACAALILECLERDLYPSWDAQNMNSAALAQKLGYVYSHPYTAYELYVDSTAGEAAFT